MSRRIARRVAAPVNPGAFEHASQPGIECIDIGKLQDGNAVRREQLPNRHERGNRVGKMLQHVREHDTLPHPAVGIISRDVRRLDVDPQRVAYQLRVFRPELHAVHLPPILTRQPQHGAVAAPEVQHTTPLPCGRVTLDEGIGLAVAAVLSCRRAWIDPGEYVFLLVDAGPAVIADEFAAWTPMKLKLVPIALSVKKSQPHGAAQFAGHPAFAIPIARAFQPPRKSSPPTGVMTPSQRAPVKLITYRLPEKRTVPPMNNHPAMRIASVGPPGPPGGAGQRVTAHATASSASA